MIVLICIVMLFLVIIVCGLKFLICFLSDIIDIILFINGIS